MMELRLRVTAKVSLVDLQGGLKVLSAAVAVMAVVEEEEVVVLVFAAAAAVDTAALAVEEVAAALVEVGQLATVRSHNQ